jgi:hypothetical protein
MQKAVVLMLMLLTCSANAQDLPCITPELRASLIISQSVQRETLWFGYHAIGTCAIDTVLCGENSPAPPDPPITQFSARWISLGFGCIPHARFDYRAYTSPADVDTYRIFMEPGILVTGFSFRWKPSEIVQMCDSAILQDEFGGTSFRKAMHIDSTLFFYMLGGPLGLMLIRYGQSLVEAVAAESQIPDNTILHQNYPNPFNPNTLITFELSSTSVVKLSVLDLLGREVAILANETMPPGSHQRPFDAHSVASGIYLCRLVADRSVRTTKMLVLH